MVCAHQAKLSWTQAVAAGKTTDSLGSWLFDQMTVIRKMSKEERLVLFNVALEPQVGFPVAARGRGRGGRGRGRA